MTCSVCNRAVFEGDVDRDGRCVLCKKTKIEVIKPGNTKYVGSVSELARAEE